MPRVQPAGFRGRKRPVHVLRVRGMKGLAYLILAYLVFGLSCLIYGIGRALSGL